VNITQLEAFTVVSKVKSISEAAQVLHLTQPALSLQMRNLENWLGVELLKRTHKGVELTPAGEVFEEYARAMLDLYRNLKKDLANLESGAGRQLLVGASSTIGNYALPCSIATFREYAPDITITLRVSNSAAVIEDAKAKSIDLGFVDRWVHDQALLVEKIGETPVVVIASPETKLDVPSDRLPSDHDLTVVPLAELRSYPLLVREPGSGVRHMVETALAGMGEDLRGFPVVMGLNSWEAIKSAVAAGKGLAFVPYFSVRKEVYTGELSAYRVRELDLGCPFCLVRARESRTPPALQKFISFMRSPRRGFC